MALCSTPIKIESSDLLYSIYWLSAFFTVLPKRRGDMIIFSRVHVAIWSEQGVPSQLIEFQTEGFMLQAQTGMGN